MLYLLDTNVLIEAKNKYYPIDRVPHFWVWILENAEQQKIRIPPQVISEVRRGYEDDPLFEWINVNGEKLELNEDWDHQMLDRTLQDGYGFKAHEIASSEYLVKGADPFLIAHALIQPIDRCVVTLESSSLERSNLPQPKNRKIDLVCHILGIRSVNTFELIRELDFRIPL